MCEVAGGGNGVRLCPVTDMVLMIFKIHILLSERPLVKGNTDNA